MATVPVRLWSVPFLPSQSRLDKPKRSAADADAGPKRLIVKNFSFGCPYAGPFKFRAQLIHNKTTLGPVHAREYNIERGKVRIAPIILTDLLPGEAYIVCVYVGNHESGACKLATTTTQKTTEVDAESEKDFCAA